MFNLNATLDNLISMVVVLLALSLVVQAVQAAIKKAFKLKSRQIEESLAHLFQFVLHNETSAQVKTPGDQPANTSVNEFGGLRAMIAQSPFLRIFAHFFMRLLGLIPWAGRFFKGDWARHPAERDEFKDAAALYNEVMNKFGSIGRTALSTRPIFDSLSKSDLLNVVGSIAPGKVDSNFWDKVEKAEGLFKELEDKFQAWEVALNGFDLKSAAGYLSDDDKAKLADMQAKFKPLIADLRMLLTINLGSPPEIEDAATTLIDDIAKLRAINLDDVLKILADVRSRIAQALERANLDNKADLVRALTVLDTELKNLSDAFTSLRQKFTDVFANWVKLENYFDTVMQSFEERYTRAMKTAVIVISFIVVVFLNANFFNVYQQISTSDTTRALILQSREDVVRALTNGGQQPTEQTVETWFNTSREEISRDASIFTGYGFAPITLHDTGKWWGTLWSSGNWWMYRKHDARVLLGWLIMALLLSVGAPFWQDFLESLFGIKNVLRKSSQTQNVEEAPGAGQTKQS
ncbi:MAG TPA: hypothetical protein VK619_07635 [Pyrinomonadaceae bacterium]|nr:hypothetical protein [Pyrinomonadaceae bacterium]